MPAEKKDRHTGADNANGDSQNIFLLKRCSLDHQAPDPLSAPFRGQNPGGPLRAYNLARTSEFAIQSAYCSSSPGQKPASGSQAVAGVLVAAIIHLLTRAYVVVSPVMCGNPHLDLTHSKFCSYRHSDSIS